MHPLQFLLRLAWLVRWERLSQTRWRQINNKPVLYAQQRASWLVKLLCRVTTAAEQNYFSYSELVFAHEII